MSHVSMPALTLLFFFVLQVAVSGQTTPMPKQITSVEGITEYQLENGMRVLLFPDATKDTVTVNNTIFVGSRHEGYGEAGMAHLLEHMVFKGTPSIPNIPKALRDHGAGRSMNGTTWLDRTNYFETMPATDENLEFAIRLEADRMVNSLIKAEDLASEMTVVRNEFERGENSPSRILRQRITSAAFDWHNYGQSTIGNRADIERVPVDSLRAFYRKYYQPDNAMVVIAGGFHPPKALEYVQTHFGAIPRPSRDLPQTYTEEPAQDGERRVTLRRVGDVAMVGVGYHIVAGSHPDFAATDILATSLAQAPSGRLYKALVETKLAARVGGGVLPTHDPNLVMYLAEVVKDVDSEQVAQTLVDVLENLSGNPLTEEEVERSRSRLLADWEQSFNNSQRVAIDLSDWAAQGDWRLYFLYRDRLESATVDDVHRIADEYLKISNRTLGVYLPTEKPSRVHVPASPDLAAMIGDYQGRGAVEMGEKFDVSTANIEGRSVRSELATGLKVVAIPKKTRGSTVDLRLTLRFGDLDSLQDRGAAAKLLGAMLQRGTTSRSRQQIRDELNTYRAKLNISSSAEGTLTVTLQAKRENLSPLLDLMSDLLNNPAFPASELETLRQQYLASYEQQQSDPQTLAQIAVIRKLRPYVAGDPRAYPDVHENIAMIQAVTVDDLKSYHGDFVSGAQGELTVIGDFDVQEVTDAVQQMLDGLPGSKAFARIPHPSNDIEEGFEQIETPDKENAMYFAGTVLPIGDSHPDYPALLIGNDIFGGAGALSSRLGDRVRQQDGLSYGVGSFLRPSTHDDRTELMLYAISNPDNVPKLRTAIREELDRIRSEGITDDELDKAKSSFVQNQRVARSNDAELAALIEKNTDANRTMEFVESFERRVQSLTVDEVNAAVMKYIDPNKIFTVVAGDFARR